MDLCPDLKNNTIKHKMTERETTDFSDISLTVVNYDSQYFRNQGTISQIVRSLADMASRLMTPINKYQEDLYPKIRGECQSIVDYYNKLLTPVDAKYYKYFGFYLNGPNNNGKRKPTTTLHERKRYNVSEFKETLKSIDDRLRHIKNDCIRKAKGINDINNNIDNIGIDTIDHSNRMIVFCDDFHKFIVEKLEVWNNFVNTSRSANGVEQESNKNIVKNIPNDLQTNIIVKNKNNVKFVKAKVANNINTANPVIANIANIANITHTANVANL